MHDDKAEKAGSVERVLSRKRRKFAKLLAAEHTQADAYEGAFNVRGGSRNAHQVNGSRIAKLPKVKELIRQSEEEMLPLGDLRAEQKQALAHLKALEFNAFDEKTPLSAGVQLYQLLEVHRQTEERIKSRKLTSHSIPVERIVIEPLQLAKSRPAIKLETTESESLDSAEEIVEEQRGEP
jgi:hypothetical protein